MEKAVVDTLTIVSLVVGVASATLAVAASVFGWVTYRNSTNMQVKAQEILAKVSEKVEVVAEHTTHQIDRAWDYFTASSAAAPPVPDPEADKELTDRLNSIREQLQVEVRERVAAATKEHGLDRQTIENLASEVADVISRTTEQTEALKLERALALEFAKLEPRLRAYIRQHGHVDYGRDYSFSDTVKHLSSFDETKAAFSPSFLHELQRLADVHNRLKHGQELSDDEIAYAVRALPNLARFFEDLRPS